MGKKTFETVFTELLYHQLRSTSLRSWLHQKLQIPKTFIRIT